MPTSWCKVLAPRAMSYSPLFQTVITALPTGLKPTPIGMQAWHQTWALGIKSAGREALNINYEAKVHGLLISPRSASDSTGGFLSALFPASGSLFCLSKSCAST